MTEFKTWGEMTPEEKGALLLAHHEWKVIETQLSNPTRWIPVKDPSWSKSSIYRVKPEPKRETVTLYGKSHGECWAFGYGSVKATYHLTFDMIDGEPDCNSVEMERIK